MAVTAQSAVCGLSGPGAAAEAGADAVAEVAAVAAAVRMQVLEWGCRV